MEHSIIIIYLVSWYFEPSQPQRVTSWLKTMFNLPSIYSARKSLNHKLSINHKISHDTNLHKIKQKTCTHALPLSCCRATSDRLPLCLYFVDHQASIQCHTDFLITSLKASSICGRHLPITAMLGKRLPEKSVRGMR